MIKNAVFLRGERYQFLLEAQAAGTQDNNYMKQKMSFNHRLSRAGICLTLLLAGGCTQLPQSQQSLRFSTANAPAATKLQNTQRDICKITTAKISNSKPPTVRSSPEVKPNNIVGNLNNGTLVSVKSEKNGWFEITSPVKGWVSKSLTQSDCNEKIKYVSFPANRTATTISSRFIGTGSHKYLLKATKGKTMTVTVEKGPLPFVFAPSDRNQQKDLTGGGAYNNKKSWSGKLAETGEYILQLESNRSGYDYKFVVQVK
ncbi:MAG TPA: SH3 domain-containing protein [Oscillatoriaceae cyanobacterium M7585_C2015_266]|nr:SH3 domain-containing protein [Oscillatoriaceae cyanobacterium M7585_C2015_266]